MDAVPPLTPAEAFLAEARGFAEQLSDTVQAVAGPSTRRFEAIVPTDKPYEAAVRQEVDEGIPPARHGVTVLSLEVRIFLIRDHREKHLRVQSSQFKVFPAGRNLPVFRYEYELGKAGSSYPAAHIQFHGEHAELAEVMQAAGRHRTRSSGADGKPNITDLHFPVGGARFRPCLEDVLEMLISEFDIDPLPDRPTALEALRKGREGWRNIQLRTAVRDNPVGAVAALTELGYLVAWPSGRREPEVRQQSLRAL